MNYYRFDGKWFAPPLDEWERPCGSSHFELIKQTLEVVKETPRGVWVNDYGHMRFVLAAARKRFAWPTEREALESFIARKKTQRRILETQLARTDTALERATVLHESLYKTEEVES